MKNEIKLITWNVNGIRACYKKGLVDFKKAHNPDILCLQETKAHIDQVEPPVRDLGSKHAYWSSAKRKGYSGVATFTEEEPQSCLLGIDIPEYDEEGRFVVTDHGAFDLYNIYFPNGGSGEERHNFKQKFLKDLHAHLAQKIKRGRPVIVVGDYNIAHTEIDVFDPVRLSKESGFLPEERAWLSSFYELGFIDTYRHFYPQKKDTYTWWSYRELARVTNRGWRIDYISITKDLLPKLTAASILDKVEGSDHCPVVAEFKF